MVYGNVTYAIIISSSIRNITFIEISLKLLITPTILKDNKTLLQSYFIHIILGNFMQPHRHTVLHFTYT